MQVNTSTKMQLNATKYNKIPLNRTKCNYIQLNATPIHKNATKCNNNSLNHVLRKEKRVMKGPHKKHLNLRPHLFTNWA